MIDRKAILKELEPKKKEAEQSKDDLMMGLYFLEEVMAVVRKRSKATQIRSIKGLIKKRKEESGKESEETELKDICWANNEFKNEETRQSERPLGFSILSIRYDEMEVRNLIEGLSFKVKNV